MRKMAVNNNWELDLQIPEKKDVLLFAENLVDYILSKHINNYLKWEPIVFRNHSYNNFLPIIRRTIDFISYTLEVNHDLLNSKMINANLFNSNSYKRFNKIIAAKYFPEGFDAKYFLLYCVNLSVMASYFYCAGTLDAPHLTKQYMYQFLQKYDVLAGGWNAICKIVENCVKMLRDSMNELTPLDSSHVSDYIVHKDQEQEEMNNDELSSLPSKEENFSSGNKIFIRFQRECAYSNIKKYLRKCAECPSKSKSQIGLCSLREPEASSGTSHVDELIIIISDFKMKTDMLWNEIQLIDKSASE